VQFNLKHVAHDKLQDNILYIFFLSSFTGCPKKTRTWIINGSMIVISEIKHRYPCS